MHQWYDPTGMNREFRAAEPHGPIVEGFPDVFHVVGRFTPFRFGHFPRTMTILRGPEGLTLLNSVRLSSEGERELSKLGKVAHVVKLGAFHGADDPYYVREHGARLWAFPRAKHQGGITTDVELTDGGELPVPSTSVLKFQHSRFPEGVVHIERHGGLLITCDSLQHWAGRDGLSVLSFVVSAAAGFFKSPVIIGPIWRKTMTKPNSTLLPDFERILDLRFAHLLAAHGEPLLDCAHWDAEQAITHVYGAN